MNVILKKILHYLALFTSIVVVILALLTLTTHIVLARLNYDVNFYEKLASEVLQHPVHIKNIYTTWWSINPTFVFEDIQILDSSTKQELINVRQIKLGFNLLASLMHWRITPSVISIVGTNLSIDQDRNGEIGINDIRLTLNFLNKLSKSQNNNSIFNYVTIPEKINLKDVNIIWQSASGHTLPLKNFNVKLSLMGNLLHVVAEADLKQAMAHLSLIANIQGSQLDIDALDANVYLSVKKLDIKQWVEQNFTNKLPITEGQINSKLWLLWRHGHIQSIQSEVQAEELTLNSPLLVNKLLLIDSLCGNFLWQKTKGGWMLSGDKLGLTLHNQIWPQNQFQYIHVQGDELQVGSDALRLNIVPIGAVSSLIQQTTLLNKQQQELLTKLAPQGQLMQVYFKRELPQAVHTAVNTGFTKSKVHNSLMKNISMQAQFKDLSFKPWWNFPGISNISGYFSSTSNAGQIALNANNVAVDFPHIFLQPLPIDKLTTLVQWVHKDGDWEITSDNLVLQNAMVNLAAAFNILVPPKGSPSVHAMAGFNMQDAQELMNYLPVRIMSKEGVDWLQQAFLHDGDLSGNLILQGNLDDFPFDKQQGIFLIEGQAKNISLHFAKDWPLLTKINADLKFENAGMYITAYSADVSGLQLQNAEADIPDLRHSELLITAAVKGNLAKGLAYVKESPLKNTLGKQLPEMQATGMVSVNLNLDIPLYPDQITVKVQGDLTLTNNQVTLPEWNLAFENVAGNLQFTDETVASQLTAILFKQPITIDIQTLKPAVNTHVIKITTAATLTATQIQEYLNVPQTPYMQGSAQVNAELQVKKKGTKQNSLFRLTSDLSGMALDLPAPLNKIAAKKIPFSLEMTEQKTTVKTMKFWLKYGKYLNAEIAYQINNTLAGISKLTILGRLNEFNLDIWRKWYERWLNANKDAAKNTNALPNIIESIDLTFDKLKAFGQQLNVTRIHINPADQAWVFTINSNPIEGKIVLPIKGNRSQINANFKRLYLAPVFTDNEKSFNPSQIPALKFTADNFSYKNKRYGSVDLYLAPLRNGVAIETLKIAMSTGVLTAIGEWTVNKNKQLSRLEGNISSNDWGALLKELDMTNSMEHGQGKIGFNLLWPSAPYEGKLANLHGNIEVALKAGNIVNLSSKTEAEIGLGRVLNMFSLQSITRRLTLNFSDLTEKGFSYDTLEGSFKLTNGIASTNAAILEGAVAKIILKGQIGLVAKTYDLLLIVTPHITSSIPVIAAVATGFNPLIGVVAWVAEKAVTVPVNKITRNTYKVTGSWANPNIVKLNNQNN